MKKYKQVFCANSTYSLNEFLLQFPEKKGISIDQLIDETLFVMGPAIANLPFPEEQKIRINQNTTESELRHALASKQANQLPVYLNIRTAFTMKANDNLLNPFLENNNLAILSDGLSDYDTFPELVNRENVQKCYSSKHILGNFHHPKIDFFDLSDLWKKAQPQQKEKICNLFGVSEETKRKAASKEVILVTQPLSEDNMMSEKEKIELYQRIMDDYGEENIVLKPHPRETTDWQKLFPDMLIIPRQIPMELLAQLVTLKKAATFFSTGVFGPIPDEKVDFYSADFANLHSYHPNKTNEKGQASVAPSDIEKTYKPQKMCSWHSVFDPDHLFYKKPLLKRKFIRFDRDRAKGNERG